MQTRLQTRVRVPPPPPPRREDTPVSPRQDMHDAPDDDYVQVPASGTVPKRPSLVNRTDRARGHSSNTPASEEWLLRVRIPPGNPLYPPHSILSIHVTAEMTASTLAACLQQSLLLQQPIVGVFQESRLGHFYTLEHVLQIKEREVIYTVQFVPPPPQPTKPTPWYLQLTTWTLLLSSLLLIWILRYLHTAMYLVKYSAIWVYRAIVQIPLIELHRYGPWMVGWEGATLPQICSRVTYHGDENFWSRNLEECQRIFVQKQEAWLKVARPLWWMVLLGLCLFTVRWLVSSFRHPPPPPVDREMVETYRAWQILLQQANKAFHPQTIRAQPHPERPKGQTQYS